MVSYKLFETTAFFMSWNSKQNQICVLDKNFDIVISSTEAGLLVVVLHPGFVVLSNGVLVAITTALPDIRWAAISGKSSKVRPNEEPFFVNFQMDRFPSRNNIFVYNFLLCTDTDLYFHVLYSE